MRRPLKNIEAILATIAVHAQRSFGNTSPEEQAVYSAERHRKMQQLLMVELLHVSNSIKNSGSSSTTQHFGVEHMPAAQAVLTELERSFGKRANCAAPSDVDISVMEILEEELATTYNDQLKNAPIDEKRILIGEANRKWAEMISSGVDPKTKIPFSELHKARPMQPSDDAEFRKNFATYVDTLVKKGDIAAARQIREKLVKRTVELSKMKPEEREQIAHERIQSYADEFFAKELGPVVAKLPDAVLGSNLFDVVADDQGLHEQLVELELTLNSGARISPDNIKQIAASLSAKVAAAATAAGNNNKSSAKTREQRVAVAMERLKLGMNPIASFGSVPWLLPTLSFDDIDDEELFRSAAFFVDRCGCDFASTKELKLYLDKVVLRALQLQTLTPEERSSKALEATAAAIYEARLYARQLALADGEFAQLLDYAHRLAKLDPAASRDQINSLRQAMTSRAEQIKASAVDGALKNQDETWCAPHEDVTHPAHGLFVNPPRFIPVPECRFLPRTFLATDDSKVQDLLAKYEQAAAASPPAAETLASIRAQLVARIKEVSELDENTRNQIFAEGLARDIERAQKQLADADRESAKFQISAQAAQLAMKTDPLTLQLQSEKADENSINARARSLRRMFSEGKLELPGKTADDLKKSQLSLESQAVAKRMSRLRVARNELRKGLASEKSATNTALEAAFVKVQSSSLRSRENQSTQAGFTCGFTGEELDVMRAHFAKVDKNHTGDIDREEFVQFFNMAYGSSSSGANALKPDEVRDIFDRLDVDGSGALTFDEFIDTYKTIEELEKARREGQISNILALSRAVSFKQVALIDKRMEASVAKLSKYLKKPRRAVSGKAKQDADAAAEQGGGLSWAGDYMASGGDVRQNLDQQSARPPSGGNARASFDRSGHGSAVGLKSPHPPPQGNANNSSPRMGRKPSGKN